MMIRKSTVVLVALALAVSPLPAERTLDIDKDAKKQEIRDSMMGFRNTLLIYKFTQQKAVLTLLIDNKDETFPISGTVHLFNEATSDEGLDKWINNQHSDALFADAPEPVFSHALPKDSCTITSRKKGDAAGNPPSVNPANGKAFHAWDVGFSVKEQGVEKQFVLPAFAASAKVLVEAKP